MNMSNCIFVRFAYTTAICGELSSDLSDLLEMIT
jgi:DNA-binding Xre family transcriptional regulator